MADAARRAGDLAAKAHPVEQLLDVRARASRGESTRGAPPEFPPASR